MRMVVVLPEPFGPRKPTISPGRDRERDVVDDDRLAEALGEVPDVDDVGRPLELRRSDLTRQVDVDDLSRLQAAAACRWRRAPRSDRRASAGSRANR